jgi:adenosylcobinamide-GDP ribazoletransferase
MRQRLAEIRGAFALLTRLPVRDAGAAASACVWTYPLAGAVVGALGGGAYWMARAVHLAPPLAALWAVAVMLLATGALHEDGLADVADGFGGGRDAAAKLAIMRDSRIGSYGVLALLVAVGIRVAAIAAMPPAKALAVLVAAGALSRSVMVVPLLRLKPARPGGLGASLEATTWRGIVAGLLLATMIAVALLPLWRAAGAGELAALLSVAMAFLARRQIGGYTGDLLGATCVVAECAMLSLLSLPPR